jgi:hypothetical protein
VSFTKEIFFIMENYDETDFDITDMLNTMFPGEKHLPGMNYCGRGTKLEEKLNEDDTPKPEFFPTDRVDEAALRHDLSYRDHSDLKSRNKADKEMIDELLNIEQPTFRERCERCFVLPIMFLKRLMGSLVLWIMDFMGINGG